jgi:large subunit ribosomal protein L32
MAVQQKKVSKARKNKRRAHHALGECHLARCKHCGAATRPHAVCSNCGHYRGKLVIDLDG